MDATKADLEFGRRIPVSVAKNNGIAIDKIIPECASAAEAGGLAIKCEILQSRQIRIRVYAVHIDKINAMFKIGDHVSF